MPDDMALMSEPFFTLIMQAVNKERWKRRKTMSLLDLCFKSILKKAQAFQQARILEQIPKSLAKKLFNFIVGCLERNTKVVANVNIDLLLQLINNTFYEFDFQILQQLVPSSEQPFENIQMMCVLLHHIQRNCPEIEWVRLYWPSELQFFFPCQSVSQWANLKFLSIKDYICEPKTLRLLSKNHPNLGELEITIFLSEEETCECVGYLTNMKKLHSLSLQITVPNHSFVEQSRFRPQTITALMANVAAKAPSLTNFHFYLSDNFPANSWSGFVEKFNTLNLNTSKLVHLRELELEALDCEWPKSLTVGKLRIFGYGLNLKTIVHLATIPKDKLIALELHVVRAENVYQILQIFGPTLRQLGLKYGMPSGLTRQLNLYKVVEMCPVLEKLFVYEFSTTERPSNCTVTAESFSQMHTFSIYRTKYENIDSVYRSENCKLLKMFLLGSKKLNSRMHIYVDEMVPAVLEAIQQDQECLKDVRELHLDVQFPDTHIQKVMQIGKLLMLRSPCLERIKIWYQFIFNVVSFDAYLEGWFLRMAEALDVCLEYEPIFKRPLEWEAYSE